MIDPRLLEILCCPARQDDTPCHGHLKECSDELTCCKCGSIYPVEDGIPIMLGKKFKLES